MKRFRDSKGQALVEYLLLFSFMTLIAINLVKGFGSFVGGSVGSIGYFLTQELSVGVCKDYCFYVGYSNY